MAVVVIAALVYILLAVALAAAASVALAGRLPRNRWVGLRTDASLRDDATFRAANRVAAPSQAGGAVVLVLGALGALLLDGAAALAVAVAAPVFVAILIGIGAVIGQRVATAMPAEDTGMCGHSCGACSLQDECASAAR